MTKKPPVIEITPGRPGSVVPLPGKPGAVPLPEKEQTVPVDIPGTGALAIFTERAEKAAEKAEDASEKAQKAAEHIEDLGENIEIGEVVTDIKETPGGIEAKKLSGEKVEIKLVKSVNGQTPDDNGDIVLPFPITVKVLGDSDI